MISCYKMESQTILHEVIEMQFPIRDAACSPDGSFGVIDEMIYKWLMI